MSETADQPKVPKLRFPEFEGDWGKKAVGQIGPVLMCKRIFKEQTASIGEIPFFKIGSFGGEPDAFISSELYTEYREHYPFPNLGDILISAAGTIGRLVVYDGRPAYFQDSNIVWVGNDESLVTNEFLFQIYQNVRWVSENTTIARIYNENIKSTRITVPALEEQARIAGFLRVVDKRQRQLCMRCDALAEYKKGMMQRLFSRELRFTRDDGSPFPDWEEKRLSEVFEERSERDSGFFELLSVTLGNGVQRLADLDRVDNSSADKSNYKVVRVDDIAYNSMRMWQGASGLSAHDGIVSPAYTVVTCKARHSPLFWAYYFKFPDLVHLFQRYSQGLTSDTWNLKYPALSSINCWVPTELEEQQKIADFLSALDTKIDAVASQIDAMQRFKKGLLQQMFV